MSELFQLSPDILGLPTLYVVPIAIVFFACLIVFTLGIKTTVPLPPSFDTVTDGPNNGKKRTKQKQTVTKSSNGQVTSDKSKQTNVKQSTPKVTQKTDTKAIVSKATVSKVEKPKAVVKPLPVETLELNEVDIDGGDWIPVLSEKQKKKAKPKPVVENDRSEKVGTVGGKNNKSESNKVSNSNKRERKSNTNAIMNESSSVINIQDLSISSSNSHAKLLNKAANEAVVEKVLAKIERIENKAPGQLTSQLSQPLIINQYTSVLPLTNKKSTKLEVEEWTVEDPDPYIDSKTRASNQVKKIQQKIKQRKQSQSEAEALAKNVSDTLASTVGTSEATPVGEKQLPPSDKITTEIINSYDGQGMAESQNKSKKKKSNTKKDAPVVPTATGDNKMSKQSGSSKAAIPKIEPSKSKELPKVQSAPKVPSDSGSSTHSSVSVINNPSITPTSDVTDATVSDQSEGEFKVVQRKPRKPKSKPNH